MENVTAIESAHGGENHCHLGLIINTTHYHQEARQNLVVPPHPPPTPDMPRQCMSQAEMDIIRQDHKAAITRYYTALNPLLGPINIASLQVNQYLYHQNGRVSPAMLRQADTKLCKKFDPLLLIEVLFARMDEVQDLATAGEIAYTNAQM
eukprot:5217591-Ditylum_brightwellii.AAC.1